MQERSDNSHFFFRSVWRRSERGVFSLSLLVHIHLCRWDGPFWGLKCVIHKWRPNLSGSPEMWPPVAGIWPTLTGGVGKRISLKVAT